MKKIVLFLTLGSFVVMANALSTKDADVNVTINSETMELKKGASLNFDEGSSICFKSGKGRIIINETKQLSSKSKNPCVILEVKKGFSLDKWLTKQSKKLIVLFSDSNEIIKSGASLKDAKVGESKQQTYIIPTDKKEMIIYSDSFGPLPVTLNVKDTKGELLQSFVNEESDNSMFRVGVVSVDVNYTLVVTNAFGDVLLDVLLVEE